MLEQTEKSGEYTLYVPQALLAHHGVDFESLGLFQTEPPAPKPTLSPRAKVVPPKGRKAK